MPPSSAPPILQVCLRGEERSVIPKRLSPKMVGRQRLVQILLGVEMNRRLGVDDRIDDKRAACRSFGQCGPRPFKPDRVLGEDVEQNVRVDENRAHSPRNSAMISSVDSFPSPRPRRCSTRRAPRPRPRFPRAGLIRTLLPSYSKSTSVFGIRPAFSRMSCGMVTCPFDVMRMLSPSLTGKSKNKNKDDRRQMIVAA